MDHDTAISTFMSVAPGVEPDTARQYLEASNWQVDAAVELFFASDGAVGGIGGASSGPASQPASVPSRPADPEYVRPAIPARADTLYGSEQIAMQQGLRSQFMEGQNMAAAVDPFRDFGREAAGGASGSAPFFNEDEGLAALFRPPTEIMFQGNLEQAKQSAMEQNRWLLVNVQSNSEFASHRMNRDTWSHEFIKSTIESNFIFWQVYDHTEMGRTVQTFYPCEATPVTMVIDPITGAKQRSWLGFLEPEVLMEDLMIYMENPPMSQGAALPSKRRQSDTTNDNEAAASARGGGQSTEDEELARALALSIEEAGGAAAVQNSDTDMNDADVAEENQADILAERVTVAAAALPDEPPANTPDSCRIALRYPDGSRTQRRFMKTDKVSALRDLCICSVPDAAGKQFTLNMSGGMPGAPSIVLSDMDTTLDAAGCVGAMIQMNWVDA